jgi:hypothetical protein
MAMMEQARKLLNSVSTEPNAPASGPNWKTLHTLLKKAPCDQMRLARFVAERNVEAMRKLLDEVAAAPPPAPRGGGAGGGGTGESGSGDAAVRAAPRPEIIVRAEKPTAQQLKTALAAFKKRLKLTKLDQESRVGRSPLSGGAKSGIVAILPPNAYPRTYWEELEKQGQIRNTGGGFYELVAKAKPIKGDAPAKAEGEGAEAEAEAEPAESAAEEPGEAEAES